MRHKVIDEIERPLPEPITIEQVVSEDADTPAPVEATVAVEKAADPTVAADEAEVRV